MAKPVTAIQDSIAQVVVGVMHQPWERLFVNYEVVHEDDGQPVTSWVFLPVVRSLQDGELAIADLEFSHGVRNLFLK